MDRTTDANATTREAAASGPWDHPACEALIAELQVLRESMLEHEARLAPQLAAVDPAYRASAANLAHYLALRRYDLRRVQQRLAAIGLSSLGRAETHVLANLDQVLGILHRLVGHEGRLPARPEPTGLSEGARLLARHTEALLGAAPAERSARIMVTLPGEAAHDDTLVAALVAAGMDIARINCAHDDAAAWVAMAARVRHHARRCGRPVRVLMDLGGPKLRTGALCAGPAVVHLKPERDALGRVVQPARLGLRAAGDGAELPGAALTLAVERDWLETLDVGDRVELVDTRGRPRRLRVAERAAAGVLLECRRSLWLADTTEIRRAGDTHGARLQALPREPGALWLQRGTRLVLQPERDGHPADPGATPPAIGCTLPQALAQARKGDRVWFDDGHLGGVVRRSGTRKVEVEITHARDGGQKLGADKGINLPDTELDLPALTAQDLADLPTVAAHADLVGLSFTQSAADVQALRAALAALPGPAPALMLKLETRRGFEALPEILLAAMAGPAAGVMIARGDLAVECGFERLAEVQEEILWACEAAHLPVVWATQVLEGLAKTGQPSRAEITDAAMAGRAECVMLNKGPHVVDAIRTLDDILRRMQAHQDKKRPLLRALKSWGAPAVAPQKRPRMVQVK
ncbi:pyruvate kinase [Rubrivivax benzoatilyticus]|uniref:pyruvate kinase n=1 Tax=Rubrivivax benzoatilyticus TaxID=316997 RepID=A0ABX0HY93_9BURK|nr:pyruvate kinase [Rubrivivax benzoatilyticus]EGJ11799.1 pyruvate kinase [Rubrivivax benzoatilyticus JA2 = ATCC BAA-35]NHK98576.1 pyruvate kinase [Rubrivivax benzoatilyticus]NHL23649.1 pyruvate kinase [Rubrivivax benzoatilyticus]